MKFIRVVPCIALIAALLSTTACGNGHSGETYIFISTNVRVPYWQTASAGFLQSASQIKVGYEFTGPQTYDPQGERTALEYAINKKPAGIVVSVADANAL